jgi:hypothetical protein
VSRIIYGGPGTSFSFPGKDVGSSLPLSHSINLGEAVGGVAFSTQIGSVGTPFSSMLGLRDSAGHLVAGVILRADNSRIILDLGSGSSAKSDTKGDWFKAGELVHWAIQRYDDNSIYVMAAQDGTATPKMVNATLLNTNPIAKIDISIGKIVDSAYWPLYGWEFSDFSVFAADSSGGSSQPATPPAVSPVSAPSPASEPDISTVREVLAFLTIQNEKRAAA